MTDRPEPTEDADGQWWSGGPKPHRICGGRRKEARGGGRCHERAGHGTDHPGFGPCKNHLGTTEMVSRGAFRNMARSMGSPVDLHPAEGMKRTLAMTAGHMFWLEEKVGEFRFRELTKLDEDGVETEQFMTPNQVGWWKIYCEERDRYVKYCEIALRAGLAQRAVELAEAQGRGMVQVVQTILDGLQLTEDQLARVPQVVPQAFRQLAIVS